MDDHKATLGEFIERVRQVAVGDTNHWIDEWQEYRPQDNWRVDQDNPLNEAHVLCFAACMLASSLRDTITIGNDDPETITDNQIFLEDLSTVAEEFGFNIRHVTSIPLIPMNGIASSVPQ